MQIRKSRTHARLLCGVAGAALILSAGAAQAADDKRISIAPQPLASALHEFGIHAGTGAKLLCYGLALVATVIAAATLRTVIE